MAVGKPLKLRLFLEGIEVPIISASLTINVNAPAAAALQIIPLDEALDLKPRTMVHVFFLDTVSRRDRDGNLQNVGNNVDHQYKLLFTGETVALSYVQTPQSRAVVLQCVDFSNYWDSAHAMAIEYGPGGNVFSNFGSIYAGAVGTFDDIMNTQPDRIAAWMNQQPKTPGLNKIGGLAGSVIRMMEDIGGVIPHHKGINDFFTTAELRCRMLFQVTAEENDSTAKRVLQGKVFDQWLRHGLSNIGQQVTFRDMMLLLMKYVYYEFVPNPSAKFDDTRTYDKTKVVSTSGTGRKIQDHLTVAQSVAYRTQRDEVQDRSAISLRGKTIIEEVEAAQILINGLSPSSSELKGVREKISNALLKVRNSAKTLLEDPDSAIGSHEILVAAMKPILDGLFEALSLIGEQPIKSQKVLSKTTEAQRLRAHIIRPDCWFSPPPTCNVIFPEQYSQLSYDRNFLGEVTRLHVATYNTLIGPDALLANQRVLAPHDAGFAEMATKTGGLTGYRILLDYELHSGIIPRSEWLPNTASTGSKSPDEDVRTAKGKQLDWVTRVALFHFFKYRYAPRQAQVAGRFNPRVVCGFPAVILQRPFIAAGIGGLESQTRSGLDAAVFTSGLTDESVIQTIASRADALGAPKQVLGMVAAIQHMVGQDGGNTAISLHSARPHKGVDDDFFELLLKKKGSKVRKILKTTIRYSQADIANKAGDPDLMKWLAAATPQDNAPAEQPSKKRNRKTNQVVVDGPKRSVNPNKPADSSKVVVTRTDEATEQAPALPPFTAYGDIPGTDKTKVLVPSPNRFVGKKGRYGGKVIGVEVLSDGAVVDILDEPGFGKVFASGVTIYETLEVTATETIPIERLLRPRWFSPSYKSSRIGEEIYQLFFGCGSILDAVRVKGSDGLDYGNEEDDDDGVNIPAEKSAKQVIAELTAEESAKATLSIEKAVNILAFLYGMVRQQGLDVDEFITQYTDRPIATLEDMFGYNLDFDLQGTKATPKKLDPNLEGPRVGFHSTAVHEKLVLAGNLAGLLDDPTTQLSLVGTSVKEPIPPRFDVRQAKRERVLAYLTAFKDGINAPGAFRG